MIKSIIFDFDGTLVDSEKTIYECFQNITMSLAPERISYAKNILIGPPLHDTVSEILGQDNQQYLDKFINLFTEMHDKNIIKNTKPYPGVVEKLKELYNKKIPMAIATNKREAPTIKLINFFGWKKYFNSIECSDSDGNLRNKNEMIKAIINKDNIFSKSYYVGDTINDGLSANQSKIKFIRAKYGYGEKQDWSEVSIDSSINNFNELELLII